MDITKFALKNEKVTIKNARLEAAGIGDRIMSLSHLDMTDGSITISSRERVLTQDFNLTNSSLKNTSIWSNYAQGNITLDHNKFDNSQFYSGDDGGDPEQWNKPYEPIPTLTVTNNTFENYSSSVHVTNHKFNTITISNNQFNNNSHGIEIRPFYSIRYGSRYITKPADVEIKNNTFTKDRQGVFIRAGRFDVTGNNFIESPGIRYEAVDHTGLGYQNYQKGFFDYKINNNTFCRQKGQNGSNNNEYYSNNHNTLQ